MVLMVVVALSISCWGVFRFKSLKAGPVTEGNDLGPMEGPAAQLRGAHPSRSRAPSCCATGLHRYRLPASRDIPYILYITLLSIVGQLC